MNYSPNKNDFLAALETQKEGTPKSPKPLRVQKITGDAWDQLALHFDDVAHEQTECFNAHRWDDDQTDRLAFWSGTELVSAVLLHSRKIPGTGVRATFSRGMPLWRPKGRTNSASYLHDVFDLLRSDYASSYSDFLLLLPRCDPVDNETVPSALSEIGCKALTPPGCKPRYFVDVTLDADALRASFAQKWRYNLKKSEKNGLTATVTDGAEGLDRFMAMHRAMVERKGFHEAWPTDSLEPLMASPHADFHPLTFIVQHQGKDIAGAVIDCSGEQANYLLGATTDEALPLKAGFFMQWCVIQHLSEIPQVRWYGLGGGTSETCSLHQFKRGLVGKNGVILDMPDAHYLAGSTYAAVVGTSALRAKWLESVAREKLATRFPTLRRA